MSLTAAAKLISGKKYSIAVPKFFKYKGEWLNDIRARMEQQLRVTIQVTMLLYNIGDCAYNLSPEYKAEHNEIA